VVRRGDRPQQGHRGRGTGGITGLIGPNGAGKKHAHGPGGGPALAEYRVYQSVLADGSGTTPRPVTGRLLPGGDIFWPELTGWEFVLLLSRVIGTAQPGRPAAASEAIEATGMREHMHRPIKGTSKGMRQRIKIAQALAHRPALAHSRRAVHRGGPGRPARADGVVPQLATKA